MNIKEVERLLSVSRANIRFYEKEGLITTDRKSNNYRDYSEENVQELKKIILFRKLGFTIDEIRTMQNGELSLDTAAIGNIDRLKKDIEKLEGALELTQRIVDTQTSFQDIDQNYYLDILDLEEKSGLKFVDIFKDYLTFEAEQFEGMWKWVFFHDFKASRKKYGVLIAVSIMLLICVVRGLSNKFLWQGSFWEGFLYPFALFLIVSVIATPIYILAKKFPKAGAVVSGVLLTACLAFLACIVILLIVLIFNSFLHFWF